MKTFHLDKYWIFSPEKLKKNNLVDTPRLFLDLYCLEPGQEQKTHLHEGSDKIYIVLEGQGLFQVGNEEKEIQKGHGILAPSGEDHGIRNNSGGRLVIIVFMAPKP